MKKVIMAFALVLISALCFAGNQQTKASKDSTNSGQVVVMDKNMFINDVFDYQNTPDWKYKGKLPAIIDPNGKQINFTNLAATFTGKFS